MNDLAEMLKGVATVLTLEDRDKLLDNDRNVKCLECDDWVSKRLAKNGYCPDHRQSITRST